VEYSEIKGELSVFGPAHLGDYSISNGWDLRAGSEIALPVRSSAVVLRAGFATLSPNALRFDQPSLPEEFATFVGVTRRTVGSAGLSLNTRLGLDIEFAGQFGGERGLLLASLRMRF
jgi:hypothetical protein